MRIHYLLEDAKPEFVSGQDNPDFPLMNSATQRFAGTYPGEILAQMGHAVFYHFTNRHTGPRKDIDFQAGDVVLGIRNYYTETARTMDRAREAGAITVKQMNDPHILSDNDSLLETRIVHFHMLQHCDAVIACSPKIGALAAQYNQNIAIIHDCIDGFITEPAVSFSMSSVLSLATTCYAHNHGDIRASIQSLENFAARQSFDTIYEIVTKGARADQAHHGGNDFDFLMDYKSPSDKLHLAVTEYSVLNAINALQQCDVVLIQDGADTRTGYKKDWHPNKSYGRGASAIAAGKPFYCPSDVESYQIFLNQNGGYNIHKDVGTTLQWMLNASPDRLKRAIKSGQEIVAANNTDHAIAQKQFDFFKRLREEKGFTDHGPRP